MACNITDFDQEWKSTNIDAGIVSKEADTFSLKLLPDPGMAEDGTNPFELQEGIPLAVKFEADGLLKYRNADWEELCLSAEIHEFALNPGDPSCSFNFRRDGTGIGTSDIRSNGLRVIYVNLADAPIVFVRHGERVTLRMRKSDGNYFNSPDLSYLEPDGGA